MVVSEDLLSSFCGNVLPEASTVGVTADPSVEEEVDFPVVDDDLLSALSLRLDFFSSTLLDLLSFPLDLVGVGVGGIFSAVRLSWTVLSLASPAFLE